MIEEISVGFFLAENGWLGTGKSNKSNPEMSDIMLIRFLLDPL